MRFFSFHSVVPCLVYRIFNIYLTGLIKRKRIRIAWTGAPTTRMYQSDIVGSATKRKWRMTPKRIDHEKQERRMVETILCLPYRNLIETKEMKRQAGKAQKRKETLLKP